MTLFKRISTIAFAVLLCVSAPPARAEEGRLLLTGSSTVAPLASEIALRFEDLHPGTRIDVQMGGSTRGVNDARSGLADIGMASRKLKEGEEDLTAFTIANDGIGIIVNKANAVSILIDGEIKAIFTGDITNWKELGGRDAPITVVNKAEGRSTLELFLEYFSLKASEVKAHVVIGDNQQGIKTVAGNPDAIGYVSIGTGEFEERHGTPIKLLGLNGVAASIENVRNGTYPLSRPLNLVTSKAPQGMAKTFIEFARSEQVHDIVEEQYFVPLQP